MRRPDLFKLACAAMGRDALKVVSVGTGWPGIVEIASDRGPIPIALHVSRVSPHARKEYEWRFQYPGNRDPVVSPDGILPILLGVAEVDEKVVFVAFDGNSRVGKIVRSSLLFNGGILMDAARDGWAEYTSTRGERAVALHPRLLAAYVEMLQSGIFPEGREVANAASASGVVAEDDEEAAERARIVVSRLVRNGAFSRDVREAYNGRCALCDLSLDLVVGAHIWPVSAKGAPDKVWNGLALCHNHHAAFDKYYIWIDPTDRAVKFRPNILEIASTDAAAKIFTQNTRPNLISPKKATDRPRLAMFQKRYEELAIFYGWAG